MQPMRRLTTRAFLIVCLLVCGAAILWGPIYARGASLVIRAAQLRGFLLSAAQVQAQHYTTGPVITIPTRHGGVRGRLYRPDEIRRAADAANRRAFASGRNRITPPSAARYALSPSKISCA